MKKLLAAVFGLVGFAWLRRRNQPEPAVDPAADLRAKLAEAREAAPAQQEDAEGEQAVDEAVSLGGRATEARPEDPAAEGGGGADVPDVQTRRSDVHDRARQAIDDLSQSEE